MAIQPPFNLNQWLSANRDTLKPPVGNKNLYKEAGAYIVMVVAGPNARKDYHYNETEELFYQLEGTIEIYIQAAGKRKKLAMGPGDMYLGWASSDKETICRSMIVYYGSAIIVIINCTKPISP